MPSYSLPPEASRLIKQILKDLMEHPDGKKRKTQIAIGKAVGLTQGRISALKDGKQQGTAVGNIIGILKLGGLSDTKIALALGLKVDIADVATVPDIDLAVEMAKRAGATLGAIDAFKSSRPDWTMGDALEIVQAILNEQRRLDREHRESGPRSVSLSSRPPKSDKKVTRR